MRRHGLAALLIVALGLLALPAGAAAAVKPNVTVMSRNLYLGANLKLGTRATSLQALADVAGTLLKQVDANRFPVRARGLAAEILSNDPDLVGLQEVALWRTGPCTETPLPPQAKTVRYDYLKLLLSHLRGRYRVVTTTTEFDVEAYVNQDGNANTAKPGCPFGSELNGRVTLRDVVLARKGRVSTSNVRGGNFTTQLRVNPGGVPLDVARGWNQLDARVGNGPRFRLVHTHLEAFDNDPTNQTNQGTTVTNGQIREAQARQLVAPGGPATGRLPVILLGDTNSDTRTRRKPGDQLADQVLRHAGFADRMARRPFSCCLHGDILKFPGRGRLSNFNHIVDHVMTNAGRRVRLVVGRVTGRRPSHGFWDSDHAGLVSALRIR